MYDAEDTSKSPPYGTFTIGEQRANHRHIETQCRATVACAGATTDFKNRRAKSKAPYRGGRAPDTTETIGEQRATPSQFNDAAAARTLTIRRAKSNDRLQE